MMKGEHDGKEGEEVMNENKGMMKWGRVMEWIA